MWVQVGRLVGLLDCKVYVDLHTEELVAVGFGRKVIQLLLDTDTVH